MYLIKIIRLLGLSILVCLCSTIAYTSENLSQQTAIKWQPWQSQIFAHDQQHDRLVLLDLTAKWCEFCQKMKKITYRDQAVADIINQKYVAIRADEADYPELVERYKNDGLPLTVIFDNRGNEIIKRSGYMKPQWMVWMLTAVAQGAAPDN